MLSMRHPVDLNCSILREFHWLVELIDKLKLQMPHDLGWPIDSCLSLNPLLHLSGCICLAIAFAITFGSASAGPVWTAASTTVSSTAETSQLATYCASYPTYQHDKHRDEHDEEAKSKEGPIVQIVADPDHSKPCHQQTKLEALLRIVLGKSIIDHDEEPKPYHDSCESRKWTELLSEDSVYVCRGLQPKDPKRR
jgi:hypothetical protein